MLIKGRLKGEYNVLEEEFKCYLGEKSEIKAILKQVARERKSRLKRKR
jgi:hypothetical protein